jgi:hypothetical protein
MCTYLIHLALRRTWYLELSLVSQNATFFERICCEFKNGEIPKLYKRHWVKVKVNVKVKLKQSHYRSGQTLRVPRG